MATTGRKQVAENQLIQSIEWGNVVWDQSVQQFDSAGDRDAQFPVPLDGALAYTADTKTLWVRRGAAWRGLGGPYVEQSGTSSFTTNASGNFTINLPSAMSGVPAVVMTSNNGAGGARAVQAGIPTAAAITGTLLNAAGAAMASSSGSCMWFASTKGAV